MKGIWIFQNDASWAAKSLISNENNCIKWDNETEPRAEVKGAHRSSVRIIIFNDLHYSILRFIYSGDTFLQMSKSSKVLV